jgi:hypothetical protein
MTAVRDPPDLYRVPPADSTATCPGIAARGH